MCLGYADLLANFRYLSYDWSISLQNKLPVQFFMKNIKVLRRHILQNSKKGLEFHLKSYILIQYEQITANDIITRKYLLLIQVLTSISIH